MASSPLPSARSGALTPIRVDPALAPDQAYAKACLDASAQVCINELKCEMHVAAAREIVRDLRGEPKAKNPAASDPQQRDLQRRDAKIRDPKIKARAAADELRLCLDALGELHEAAAAQATRASRASAEVQAHALQCENMLGADHERTLGAWQQAETAQAQTERALAHHDAAKASYDEVHRLWEDTWRQACLATVAEPAPSRAVTLPPRAPTALAKFFGGKPPTKPS